MKSKNSQGIVFLSIIGFSILIISVAVILTLKNTRELENILEESIKSQLISTSLAARELIDIDKFDSYNSEDDIRSDIADYTVVANELRYLRDHVGASYIYSLKIIDGTVHYIHDTDDSDTELFTAYDLHSVHELAFAGHESAGVMNLIDEYGAFNAGAVPILKDGRVIGIVCTDIEDSYIKESNETARKNAESLIISLVLTFGAIAVIVWLLLRNVNIMQKSLFKMANNDVLTGLPNRAYLMSYLPEIADNAIKNDAPFAIMLIDLDNFKRVNDNAGHDAGDELLQHIAMYLNSATDSDDSKSFRPAAGALNVSARIGGDEFVKIIHNIRSDEEAAEAARKMLENFGSHVIDKYVEKFDVGLSIGVARFPYHSENYNVLIKYADLAMYHAKRSGKHNFRVYDESMSQATEAEERSGSERRQNRH